MVGGRTVQSYGSLSKERVHMHLYVSGPAAMLDGIILDMDNHTVVLDIVYCVRLSEFGTEIQWSS